MYESFYGLSAKPFQLNPDPSFYFASREHRRAMAYLNYGLHKGEGFIVITGEVGAGKTTVIRSLLNQLDTDKVVAKHVVTSQLDAEDMLRMIGAAFALRVKDASKSEMLLALEALFVQLSMQGKRALLIVDEAQNLSMQATEELRMLSNYQLESRALLQTVLVGQPEFRSLLESPEMLQLRQRVVAGCHISPLDAEETRGYIEHRLSHVGWTGDPQFDDDTHQRIYEAAEGVPRRINTLCDRLLLAGYLTGRHAFTVSDVDEAAREIGEETRSTAAAVRDESATPPTAVAPAPHKSTNTGQVNLDPETVGRLSGLITQAQAPGLEERLARLERSSAATLAVLSELLEAIRARARETDKP